MNELATRTDDEIEQLLDDVVMVSDHRFFAQHPQREFRIRPAWEVEVERLVRFVTRADSAHELLPEDKAYDITKPLPDGWCSWMPVWRIEPGNRYRRPFSASHDLDPDPPEAIARAVWEYTVGKDPGMRRLRDRAIQQRQSKS